MATKTNPETGETLYAFRRPGGDNSLTDSMYVWRNRRNEHVMDATPEEDNEIHQTLDRRNERLSR